MNQEELARLQRATLEGGAPGDWRQLAQALERSGDLPAAASAFDRAFGLDPTDGALADARAALLDRLARSEHGLAFRYVPAGPFQRGSEGGDEDERPVRTLHLSAFWIAEVPISWGHFCQLMGWDRTRPGFPPEPSDRLFFLAEENKIRRYYSRAGQDSWQGHDEVSPPTDRPMVAASWQVAEELAQRLSTDRLRVALPTEAQWEKAARGGLVGRRYPTGDAPHPEDDLDHFGEFHLKPSAETPANGYGLRHVSGGVWEWCRDWYDRLYYAEAPDADPPGPPEGSARVLRGGSFTDCPEACTVSFRFARQSSHWRTQAWGGQMTPNVGFRLCLTEAPE